MDNDTEGIESDPVKVKRNIDGIVLRFYFINTAFFIDE